MAGPGGAANKMSRVATPAVIYAAKSTPDEHDSVPDQLATCRERAEHEGREVVDVFSEDDVSGYRQSRGPKLEAAMAAAKAAAAEHGQAELWVFHSARLARGSGRKNEARALGEVFYDLKRHGVTLRSVQDDPYVTDEAFVGMASKMANKYSEDLSGSVKAGIKRRRKGGKHNGGHIAYGYRVGGDGLEIVDHQAEIVRRIFSEFVAGKGLTEIARDLQREGVPTAEGGKWGPSTISGILGNVVHIGKVDHNGEVFPGLHEGIIDEKTWQQAADLLAARPQIERRGRPPKGRHLFPRRDAPLRMWAGDGPPDQGRPREVLLQWPQQAGC
jgi:site-specific DNA recombinase